MGCWFPPPLSSCHGHPRVCGGPSTATQAPHGTSPSPNRKSIVTSGGYATVETLSVASLGTMSEFQAWTLSVLIYHLSFSSLECHMTSGGLYKPRHPSMSSPGLSASLSPLAPPTVPSACRLLLSSAYCTLRPRLLSSPAPCSSFHPRTLFLHHCDFLWCLSCFLLAKIIHLIISVLD